MGITLEDKMGFYDRHGNCLFCGCLKGTKEEDCKGCDSCHTS